MQYIQPDILTDIESRKQVNTKDENGKLPLISAPMYSVYDEDCKFNYDFLEELNKYMEICIPREQDYKKDGMWVSISLQDLEYIIEKENTLKNTKILVDVANGHMRKLYDLCKKFVEMFPDIPLMVGNIANPLTYGRYAEIGVWGVRCGIGTGSVCETTTNTAIHYPTEKLIKECYGIKKLNGFDTKIIADGGIRSTRDINLRISWGADYVMLGSMLTQILDSNNTPYLWKKIPIKNSTIAHYLFDKNFKLYKKHQGMSTIEVQKKWGRTKETLRHSEGKTKYYMVNHTMGSLLYDIDSALRSAMSYSNCKNLEEFIGYGNLYNV